MTAVLDHGYVKLIEAWGSDERIIESARMSTNKGFQGWETDAKLLRYLWENEHATPFEFAGAAFEIQAPIFVFREWHRHRTQSYNEMSARYTPLPNTNYIPSLERVMINASGSNKQAGTAQGAAALNVAYASIWMGQLANLYNRAESLYQSGLAAGIPKELARLVIPVGRYSCMRASANLRNWLGFLRLRLAANAQWEIRQYAQTVHDLLLERFPRTLALFDEGCDNPTSPGGTDVPAS